MTNSELYYSEVHAQADEHERRREHFDTMTTAILGLSGTLAGLMVFTISEWSNWSIWPAISELVVFAATAMCTVKALWLRDWHIQPKLDVLRRHLDSYQDDAMVLWAADQIAEAIKTNEIGLSRKARWLKHAYWLLGVQVIALGILVLSSTF